MRKNTARHWLHAGLDLLPLILIPVFMIYSHRHIIDSGSIEVPVNRVVDFNQLVKNGNFTSNSNWEAAGGTMEIQDNQCEIEVVVESGYYWTSLSQPTSNLNYVDKFFVSVDLYQDTSGTVQVVFNTNVNYVEGTYYITNYGAYTSCQFIFDNPVSLHNAFFQVVKIGNAGDIIRVKNFQCFNLTQMFGNGNEPTIQQFNNWYADDYYDFTISSKQLLKGYTTLTYDDTDIMSQFTYQMYNAVDKYFNMGNVFGMSNVYDWFNLNIFGGNASISIYIVWNIVLYEFVMDLLFLLYALFMWFIDVTKRLIEKPLDSIK